MSVTISEVEGIVCINDVPVAAQFKRFNAVPRSMDYVGLADPDSPNARYHKNRLCGVGLLAAIATGSVDTAYKAIYGITNHIENVAGLCGLTTQQVRAFEAGWCLFNDGNAMRGNTSDFLRLGARAYAQATAAGE
jgi:hypothetical protein